MSWLDDLPAQRIYDDGVEITPSVRKTNFVGADISYSAANGWTTVRVADRGDWKSSVRLCTAAALNAYTFSAGANTITANANGAMPNVDGVAPAVDDRILLTTAGTTSDVHNGIWTVSSLGSGSSKWVLQRAGDADETGEISPAMTVRVEEGTVNAGHLYVCTDTGTLVLNTDPITLVDYGTGGAGALCTTVATGDVNAFTATADRWLQSDGATPGGTWVTNPRIGAGAYLQVDTGNLATTGEIRGKNNALGIYGRDTGDTTNIRVIELTGHNVAVGNTSYATSNVWAYSGASGSHGWWVGGTKVLALGASSCLLADNIYLTLGTTGIPASGSIRGPNGVSFYSERAGGADCRIFEYDAADDLYWGDAAQVDNCVYDALTSHSLDVGGTPVLSCTSALITAAQDIVFDASKVSPTLYQATKASGTGETIVYGAQSVTGNLVTDIGGSTVFSGGAAGTGGSSTGGSIYVRPGAGDTNGSINIGYNINRPPNVYFDASSAVTAQISGTPVLTIAGSLITAAQSVTLADGKVLTLGTTNPASAGAIQLRNNAGEINYRNAGNDGDIRALHVDGSDYTYVGHGVDSVNTYVDAATSWSLRVGWAATLSSTASLITAAQSVTLADGKAITQGTTNPATGYDFNVRNDWASAGRNAGNSGNIPIIRLTTGDDVVVGGNDADLDDVLLEVPSGQSVQAKVAGAAVLTVAGSLITAAQDVQTADGKTFDCGTTNCATSGTAMNWRNVASLYARDAANANDMLVLATDANDNVYLGETTHVDDVFIGGSLNTYIRCGASTVVTVASSIVIAAQPVQVPSYTVAGAPAAGNAGALMYCTNGDAGSACLAVDNGTNWKVVSLGASISAT